MKIKICGLNPTRDVQLCINQKVDFLGFVFYEKSPRNINLSEIEILSKYNKQKSYFVAVTVNPSDEFIQKNLEGKFEYIQLHGSETRERIDAIKKMGFRVIKAIKVKEAKDINNYKNFSNADVILFDTPGMEKSMAFPKELINRLPKGEKFALAGSISENNVKRDVDCFVRSYVAPNSSSVYTAEDVLECPLTELNLIRKVYGNALNAKRDFQDSIPNELFLRAIDNLRMFEGITANTITVETLLNSPYSPGNNFLLSREALTEKLENISEISENSIELDQSSGLAQIIIKDDKFKNIYENYQSHEKAVA